MTPQQRNDYPLNAHLPEHPRPLFTDAGEWSPVDTFDRGPAISPKAWAVVVALVVVGLLVGAFYAGRMTAAHVEAAKVDQAFRNGLAVGAVCAHDPALSACAPASLRSGGVL